MNLMNVMNLFGSFEACKKNIVPNGVFSLILGLFLSSFRYIRFIVTFFFNFSCFFITLDVLDVLGCTYVYISEFYKSRVFTPVSAALECTWQLHPSTSGGAA